MATMAAIDRGHGRSHRTYTACQRQSAARAARSPAASSGSPSMRASMSPSTAGGSALDAVRSPPAGTVCVAVNVFTRQPLPARQASPASGRGSRSVNARQISPLRARKLRFTTRPAAMPMSTLPRAMVARLATFPLRAARRLKSNPDHIAIEEEREPSGSRSSCVPRSAPDTDPLHVGGKYARTCVGESAL